MKKAKLFVKSWGLMLINTILILYNIVATAQVFGFNILEVPTNEKTRVYTWIIITLLLVIEVFRGRYEIEQFKQTNPILRVIEYGNEEKILYKPLWSSTIDVGQKDQSDIAVRYDTLFIDICNLQKKGDAKGVWSQIDWIDNKKVVLSHQGRWHIASPNAKDEKENLQYVDFDSNGHSRKLHFACKNKDTSEQQFYGLGREMDGRETWNSPNHILDKKQYEVKITLKGNNAVQQEFRYSVKNNNGNILIVDVLTDESKKVVHE